MLFIILTIVAVLLTMNLYASYVVIRSNRNGRRQKIMQIAFVWLLPFIGSIVTTHLLNEPLRRPVSQRRWIDTSDERAWNNDPGEGSYPHVPD